jgi:S1-C subfamily serine protease
MKGKLSCLTALGIFLIFTVFPPNMAYAELSNVVKIFTELKFEGTETQFKIRDVDRTHIRIATGCGFAIKIGGKNYLVTAKHVINPSPSTNMLLEEMGDDDEVRYDGKKNTLKTVKIRIRISGLSLRPLSVFWGKQKDIAIITLAEKDWNLLKLETLEFSDSAPKPLMPVIAWGFPETPNPQLQELKIAAVHKSYLVLNESLGHGFSGGPLVNLESELLGLIIRSEEKQSRCLIVNNTLINNLASQKAITYSDGLALPIR